MSAPSTVSPPRSGRRVVRRSRPTLDQAYDAALSELPVSIRGLVIKYADNIRDGAEIRSELCTAMTAAKLSWLDVDRAARQLL